MKIVFDPPKRRATLAVRGLDMAMIDESFFESAFVIRAREGRLKAIGEVDGRSYVVVFKRLGGEGVSIVSFRRANRKEVAWLRNRRSG